jgi:hypothetical protein
MIPNCNSDGQGSPSAGVPIERFLHLVLLVLMISLLSYKGREAMLQDLYAYNT